MRRCAQSSQRSTCPPSAAVRQRSIADMTLSWPRLTWPAWDARQAGPRWRKMSATATAGRDTGRASAGHLPQKVERAGHLADRADGDAGVERRRDLLDHALGEIFTAHVLERQYRQRRL